MIEEPLDQPWLLEVVAQVRATYPGGIPDEDLDVVLAALYEGCSNRNFALVVEVLTGVDRHIAYGVHVCAAEETVKRRRARVDEIHAEMGKHGWDPEAG
ncbi:hypothetical protein ACIA8G_40040 [Lentzea sp. NPDC051213]|uniref:hypothetical protein n=1 Tax=Lentzea sp. NPDC051213 TaxID=3364126 RepID=UPI0037AE6D01